MKTLLSKLIPGIALLVVAQYLKILTDWKGLAFTAPPLPKTEK